MWYDIENRFLYSVFHKEGPAYENIHQRALCSPSHAGHCLSGRESPGIPPILRVLEGSLAPVSCAQDKLCCGRAEQCVTQEVWAEIAAAVSAVVDHITLADLVRRYGEKAES